MNPPADSRFGVTARRALLQRSAVLGVLVLAPGLACASNDADVLGSAATTEVADPTAASGGIGTAAESTVPERASDESAAGESAAGAVLPASAELVVNFTYQAEGDGRILNPYIAVWVEDADGNLVDTISLWYEQGGEGTKWLDDLRSWYSASNQADDTTMSGATRGAGAYSVVWDGTDLDGNPVQQGEYVVFVEAAREKGPYEILSGQITLAADDVTVTLGDNGELVAVSAEYMV